MYKVKQIKDDLRRVFELNVCEAKCKRDKKEILESLEGSFVESYNKLEGCTTQLRSCNPGSDIVIDLSKEALSNAKRQFIRMYICFKAMKLRFKSGLRPLLGLDDTFLKGKSKGQGSLEGVRTVLPEAHQRYCARHIETNWCIRWGKEEFEDQLQVIKEVNGEAEQDLIDKYPPKAWCRAYIETVCKNQAVDNNFTESFNAWILEARYKPIIRMLEDIWVKIMERLAA
ncbi:uncharacterized protein [Solanum lycopersicum]|uniref:uncharacterized protein n=1 Tax=Solanum lycopersicum TaxID=4081 RepID=UPI00374A8927